ncbi:MAG: Bacterial peptide chain release factor 2 [Parcubacteria group bacterium GW2011_GWA2_43_11]|nr:MAG: Bacterial peptide chain release factor 2 [Parcubacteria group bacterium GW2011_GWA2_43_11]
MENGKADKEERIKQIEYEMCQPDFWSNPEKAQALIQELQDLKTEKEGGSPYDKCRAIISIYAGAGGDDAEDFASILAKRHTSFVLVEVLPVIEKKQLEIPETDFEISFAKSSGPGGQNVNKRETAVRVVHTPTGIAVHVEGERTQNANREKALALIEAKLVRRMEEERKETLAELSTDAGKIEWGSQIRSYVLHPYQMIKDHRTGVETSKIDDVLERGELDMFLEAPIPIDISQ